MNRTVSHPRIIGSIVRKDLTEYGRDRLWAFLTVLVLIIAVGIFWLLPDEVDEGIDVGIAGLPPQAVALAEGEEGFRLVPFDSPDDLERVVAGEAEAWRADGNVEVVEPGTSPDDGERIDIGIGIAFPPDFVALTAGGEGTEVTVYVDAAVPEEIETTVSGIVREFAFAIAGENLPIATSSVDEVYVVLGEDRAGDQVPFRESIRPLFVFLVLVMEMFVMASLIARELQSGTISAILVTPATVGDVLAAKGIAGAASGLVQGLIVLVAIGSLGENPFLVFTLILLGSVMVAGTAMIVGSSGHDFMGTLFYGMAYMVPLLIPAFAALLPGTAAAWVRAIPSYPLVEGLIEVTSYGSGWSELLPQLGTLLAWCVALFALGWVILRRKVSTA